MSPIDEASMEFLKPWHPVDNQQLEAMSREVLAEVSSGHELYRVRLRPIARSQQADDVLFKLDDERVAMVHLTWSRRPEPPPSPSARIFPTLDDWAREIMIPENELY